MLSWNLAATPAEVRAKLPSCYSKEFDDCIQEYERARVAGRAPTPSAYCNPVFVVMRATTTPDWDATIDTIPYCSTGVVQKRKAGGFLPALAVIGIAAGAIAIVVNATGSRF